MGFGRFSVYKKLHKRKRTAAEIAQSTTPHSEQEEGTSSNFEDGAETVQKENCWWNEDVTGDRGARRQGRDDTDDDADDAENDDDSNDDDEDANTYGSYYSHNRDHGDAGSHRHESQAHYDDEQGVSMDLDTESAPQFDSQYYLLTSSSACGSFLHSSGRPLQETTYDTARRTIDSEFEEYFASLLLK